MIYLTDHYHMFVCVAERTENGISGIMAIVFTSSAVDRAFESRSGQTKDYENDMCYFSAKHTAVGIKCKDWLALH